MDARLLRISIALFTVSFFTGANYRTQNFVVTAATPQIAQSVGRAAEDCRKRLAKEWVGYELPRWSRPCPISVRVGQIGAGGQTRFRFESGADGETHVFGWNMEVQGTLERVLDSVIPHEVSHTIFASHFRRGLPRWADEGAATLSEHESERNRQLTLLNEVIRSGRPIPLRKLFGMKEYPRDMRDVLTLYAEGYSLAEFLVQQAGRRRYMKFLEDAHHHGWSAAIKNNYRHENVDSLEQQWRGWFLAGSPRLDAKPDILIAEAPGTPADSIRIRSQSPEDAFANELPNFPAAASAEQRRTGRAVSQQPEKKSLPGRVLQMLSPRRNQRTSGGRDVAFQKVVFPKQRQLKFRSPAATFRPFQSWRNTANRSRTHLCVTVQFANSGNPLRQKDEND